MAYFLYCGAAVADRRDFVATIVFIDQLLGRNKEMNSAGILGLFRQRN